MMTNPELAQLTYEMLKDWLKIVPTERFPNIDASHGDTSKRIDAYGVAFQRLYKLIAEADTNASS